MITKSDLVKQIGVEKFNGFHAFDYALPQNWADEVRTKTGIYPAPFFIWLYDSKSAIFGRPYPLNIVGWVICKIMKIEI